MMKKQTSFKWAGRVDTQESGVSTRWHQHVRDFTADSRGGCALIGFRVDEGVRRNAGRPGAARGPQALRQALGNLPVLDEPAVFDLGDAGLGAHALEAAQEALAERVAAALRQDCLPVVLGGGHEVAWGTFQGIMRARPGILRLLIVNLDAHFDLRVAAQANSGTPFRQMQEWSAARGRPFNYRVFGISRFANTRALFDRADGLGVRYWLDEALQGESGLRSACEQLAEEIRACDAVYLTICLDVLPGGVAPGVSAPAPLGVPLAGVEALIDEAAGCGKLVAADIAELNPEFDRDGLTARVAARLAARIVRRGGK